MLMQTAFLVSWYAQDARVCSLYFLRRVYPLCTPGLLDCAWTTARLVEGWHVDKVSFFARVLSRVIVVNGWYGCSKIPDTQVAKTGQLKIAKSFGGELSAHVDAQQQ